MIYGYARVSSAKQGRDGNSLEAQERALREAGAAEVFTDTYTGTKLSRPRFDELRGLLQPGDTLMVTKLDRLARSASQGSQLIEELIDKGVRVHVLNMGLMDDTPTGRLIRNIMFAFAEFERDMIVQRTQEGLAVARQREDFHEGRPKKEIGLSELKNVRKKQKDGRMTAEECAKSLGISRATYQRALRQHNLL